MSTESKITGIYYMANDFTRNLALQQEKYMVENRLQTHCLLSPLIASLTKKPAIALKFVNDGQLTIFQYYIKQTLVTCELS